MPNQPTRSLIAYAVFADRLTKGGDLFQALCQFFTPICADLAGKPFVPKEFADEVGRRYCLQIPTIVVQSLAEKLEKEGLLAGAGPKHARIFTYRSDIASSQGNGREITEVLEEFRTYARGRISELGMSDDELDEEFFRRLIDVESLRVLAGKDRTLIPKQTRDTLQAVPAGGGQNELPSSRQKLAFVVAEFLLEAKARDREFFAKLEGIAFANLAAEALVTFTEPPGPKDSFANVVFYVDAPLVLDMLGVNPGLEEYGRELLQLLRATGAPVRMFTHSLLEAERVISARRASYLDSATSTKFSPDPAGVRELIIALDGQLDSFVADQLGIQVEDAPSPSAALRINFTPEDEAAMRKEMLAWGTQEAKDADVKSVMAMAQLRGAISPPARLVDTKQLMITRNSLLAHLGNYRWRDSLRQRNGELTMKRAAPLLVSDRRIAGLVWITEGGYSNQIVRSRLVANCQAAIQPKRDVAVRAYNLLLDTSPEQAKLFEAVIQDQRVQRALNEKTFGDYRVITPDNVLRFVDDLLQLEAKQVEESKNKEIQKLIEERAAEKERERIEKAQIELNLEQKDAHITELTRRIRGEEARRLREKRDIVESIFERATIVHNCFPFVLGFLVLIASGYCSYYFIQLAKTWSTIAGWASNVPHIELWLSALIALPLAWKVPNLLFDKLQRHLTDTLFRWLIDRQNLGSIPKLFDPNFDEGTFSWNDEKAVSNLQTGSTDGAAENP